jgi:hypothetical protein
MIPIRREQQQVKLLDHAQQKKAMQIQNSRVTNKQMDG